MKHTPAHHPDSPEAALPTVDGELLSGSDGSDGSDGTLSWRMQLPSGAAAALWSEYARRYLAGARAAVESAAPGQRCRVRLTLAQTARTESAVSFVADAAVLDGSGAAIDFRISAQTWAALPDGGAVIVCRENAAALAKTGIIPTVTVPWATGEGEVNYLCGTVWKREKCVFRRDGRIFRRERYVLGM